MNYIKTLHGRDCNWIQISFEEYKQNYTDDKINFAFIVDQDTNKGAYYKRDPMIPFGRGWFLNNKENNNERMED